MAASTVNGSSTDGTEVRLAVFNLLSEVWQNGNRPRVTRTQLTHENLQRSRAGPADSDGTGPAIRGHGGPGLP